jgi:formylglycine-generating enzyme required for sulfatase activity
MIPCTSWRKHYEQRAKSKEQRAKSKEQRAKSKEQSNYELRSGAVKTLQIVAAVIIGLCFYSSCSDMTVPEYLDKYLPNDDLLSNPYVPSGPIDEDSLVSDIAGELVFVPGIDIADGFAVGDLAVVIRLNPFYMSEYEVTQAQWEAVVGTNLSSFQTDPAAGETQKFRPVETITWFDAVDFCNQLSALERLDAVYTITGGTTVSADWAKNGYRLPTEAEWEYAARAGGVPYDYDTDPTTANLVAWYNANSSIKTHQVGMKQANAFGLYDMAGNVYEWCWDRDGSYPSSADNPTGDSSGMPRVVRGEYYNSNAGSLDSSLRGYLNPNSQINYVGFRLVRSAQE